MSQVGDHATLTSQSPGTTQAGEQMTYVITFTRRDRPPRVVTDFDGDEATAKDFCTSLIEDGMVRVGLHSLAEDGLIAPVALWIRGTNGRAVRKRNVAAPERPQETAVPAAPEGEDEDILSDSQAAQEWLDEHGESHKYDGFCVKCREHREFYGEVVEMANGRRAAKGKCPVCGTGMNRILKNVEQADEWHDDEPAAEAEETVNPDDDPDAGLDEDEEESVEDENPDDNPDVPEMDEDDANERAREEFLAQHELERSAGPRGTHLTCACGEWEKWVTRKTEKAGRAEHAAHVEEMLDNYSDDVEAADYDRAHPDSVPLAIESAISEAVPEGTPVEEIAEAAAQVVEELVEAEAEPPVKETPKPRKRASRAKAKEKEEPAADPDLERVRTMKVTTCRYCNKKVPVKEAAGLRILSQHPDADKGLDRCPGSLVTLD